MLVQQLSRDLLLYVVAYVQKLAELAALRRSLDTWITLARQRQLREHGFFLFLYVSPSTPCTQQQWEQFRRLLVQSSRSSSSSLSSPEGHARWLELAAVERLRPGESKPFFVGHRGGCAAAAVGCRHCFTAAAAAAAVRSGGALEYRSPMMPRRRPWCCDSSFGNPRAGGRRQEGRRSRW